MKRAKESIVLITNSIVPYRYDVAKLLALPPGLPYRFRYIKKWLPSDLPLGQLKGRNAVIVLRVFDTAQLIPVRFGTIFDVSEFGEMVRLEFFVEEYVGSGAVSGIVKQLESALAGIQADNTEGKHLTPLIFAIDNFQEIKKSNKLVESDVADWDRIVNELGMLSAYRDYNFFKILSIKDSNGTEANFIDDEVRGKKAYCIRPAKLYFVELLQKMTWNIDETESIPKEFLAKLSCYDDTISVKQAYQKIVGKYDLLRFSFRSALTYRKRYASLFLDMPQNESSDLGESVADLPIVLSPGVREKSLKWIKVTFVILGSAGAGWSAKLAQFIGWAPEIVLTLSIILVVISTTKWEEVLAGYRDKVLEIKP